MSSSMTFVGGLRSRNREVRDVSRLCSFPKYLISSLEMATAANKAIGHGVSLVPRMMVVFIVLIW